MLFQAKGQFLSLVRFLKMLHEHEDHHNSTIDLIGRVF